MSDLEKEESPIDFERLREVSADDVELMNELIDLYFPQTRELLDELKNAVAQKNAGAVYQAAHKALGSSVTCGMTAVIEPLRELEEVGRNNDFENAEQFLSQAEEGYAKLQAYLDSNREKLSN